MSEFGNLLRNFRELCRDPLFPARKLSQQKFGELLGNELGAQGYSGAAVSDWERGKSKIHADDRLVLTALVRVLHERGGLQTLAEANRILEAGNYRALDANETQKIFGEFLHDADLEEKGADEKTPKPSIPFLIESLFAAYDDESQELVKGAQEGPPPSWSRVLAAFMRRFVDRFPVSLTTIAWIGVWIGALWLVGPSLRLPFANRETASLAIGMYICGTLVVPLLIGLLINTRDDDYWKRQQPVNPFLLRLYTYQGAGIGFNLGYFFVFPIGLARHYLDLSPAVWVEIAAATAGLILGSMAARVVPYNLWLAYGRLTFTDGGIFFIVALVGPLWGFFFLEYYSILLAPFLGILLILSAVTITVIISKQQAKNGSPVINGKEPNHEGHKVHKGGKGD